MQSWLLRPTLRGRATLRATASSRSHFKFDTLRVVYHFSNGSGRAWLHGRPTAPPVRAASCGELRKACAVTISRRCCWSSILEVGARVTDGSQRKVAWRLLRGCAAPRDRGCDRPRGMQQTRRIARSRSLCTRPPAWPTHPGARFLAAAGLLSCSKLLSR